MDAVSCLRLRRHEPGARGSLQQSPLGRRHAGPVSSNVAYALLSPLGHHRPQSPASRRLFGRFGDIHQEFAPLKRKQTHQTSSPNLHHHPSSSKHAFSTRLRPNNWSMRTPPLTFLLLSQYCHYGSLCVILPGHSSCQQQQQQDQCTSQPPCFSSSQIFPQPKQRKSNLSPFCSTCAQTTNTTKGTSLSCSIFAPADRPTLLLDNLSV